MRRSLAGLAALLLCSAAAVETASARRISVFHQVRASAPARIGDQIGFVPIQGFPRKTVTFRAGRDRYVGTWENAIGIGATTTKYLSLLRRQLRYRDGGWTTEVVFADRPLRRKERRHFEVAVDLWRDADVLVVAAGHPACGGISYAQARAITAGRIRRWSEVAALGAGDPDAIKVRVVGHGDEASHERRFGAPLKLPSNARVRHDGGLSEVLGGDRSVAAITSWSRVRGAARSLCVVPLNGVAPDNESVYGLRFPGAYPVQIVIPRKRVRSAYARKVRAAYLKFHRSEKGREMYRRTGVLMVGDPLPQPQPAGPPAPAGPTPPPEPDPAPPPEQTAPAQDAQGRPITAVRDDAAAAAGLTGERLSQTADGVLTRYAFEADGALVRTVSLEDGSGCAESSGGWQLIEGWRYPEHGGGVIATVRLLLEEPRDVVIDLPGDAPATAYVDGSQHARSQGGPPGCA